MSRRIPCLLLGLSLAMAVSAQQPALESWSYKGRGDADPAAGEGAARLLPPGDSNEASNHKFDWNLYNLSHGRYRISVRVKVSQKPTIGVLSMYADVIPYGSGQGWAQPTVLRVEAEQVTAVGTYQTFTGEFEHTNPWPYTYWFFRFRNGFRKEVELWLDRVDLELLERLPAAELPAALQSWRFEGKGVNDPQAPRGEAGPLEKLEVSYELPLGRYDVSFRIRSDDPTGDQLIGIASAIIFGVGGVGAGGNAGGQLDGYYVPKPSSFRPGRYETVSFPFQIVYPSATLSPFFRAYGCQLKDMRLDSVEIRLLERYTEAQAAEGAKIPRAEPALLPHQGKRAWLVEGLYSRETGIPAALALLGYQVTNAWFINYHENYKLAGQAPDNYRPEGAPPEPEPEPAAGDLPELDDKDQPERPRVQPTDRPENPPPDWVSPDFEKRIMAHDVVVLQDIPGRLLTLQRRVMLHDYVMAGGGLVIVGGMYGLDRGGYQFSDLLAEILPAALAATPSLHPLTPPRPLRPTKGSPFAPGLPFGTSPVAAWTHTVVPKPGAFVHLTAGQTPVFITWRAGKGRVALLAAPPYGVAPAGAAGYWEWPPWTEYMRRVIQWAAGG